MALDTDPASPNYGKDVDADFAQVAAQYGILPQRQAAGLGDPTQLSPQGASAEATRLSTPFGQAQQALGTFNAVPDLTSKAISDLDAWRVKTFGDVGATTSPLVTTPLIDAQKIQPAQPVTLTDTGDISADQLDSKLGGALRGKGSAIVTAAAKYNISPALLASISMAETGNGSSHMINTKNNPAGIWDGKTGTYRTFGSVEDGLDFTARTLKNGYINQGLTTPEQIGPKWAPVGASNDPQQTNATWPALVRARLGQLGVKGPLQAASGQTASAATGQTTGGQQTTGGAQPTTDDLTGPIYIHPVDPATLKPPSPVPGQQLSTDELTTWARAQTDQYAKALADAGTPMNGDEYKQAFGGFFASGQKINMGILPERLPADQISSLEALDEGNRQIDNVVALLDKFRAAHPQAIAGTKVPNVLDPLVKASDEYKAFDAARSLAMMPLARGVGGMTSRVSDVDLGTIKDALPNEFDTPAQAQQKADILKTQALDMMQKKIQYFAASNYDVNRFVPLYQQAVTAFKSSPSQAQQDNTGRTAAQKTAVQQTRANRVAALTRPTPLLPPQPPSSNTQPNIFETQTNEALPPALTGAPTD